MQTQFVIGITKSLEINLAVIFGLVACLAHDFKMLRTGHVHEHKNINLYPSLKEDLQLPGLKISHINVNGLLHKLLDIKALIRSIKFDILAITESHLSEDISDDEIAITGYKTAQRDRNDGLKGGVTVIYFAEYECQDINVNNSLEAAWIDVTVASQRLRS